MQADDVGLGQKILQGLDRLGVAMPKPVGMVVEDHLHAHRFGKHRQLRSDIAVADDAEGAASHLAAVLCRLVPRAFVGGHGAGKDPTKQHDDFADHQLRHAAGIRERRVKDGNAAPAGGVEIDLVGPHAETSHDGQPVGAGKDIVGQLGSGTNAEQFDALDGLAQRARFQRLRQAFDADIFRIQEQFDGAVVHALQQKGLGLLLRLRGMGRHFISMDHRRTGPSPAIISRGPMPHHEMPAGVGLTVGSVRGPYQRHPHPRYPHPP